MNSNSVDRGNARSPLDYEIDITHPQIPGDISYGALTFYRNRNPNGLSPTLHEDSDRAPWLRLAVAKDAYLGATDGDPNLVPSGGGIESGVLSTTKG